MHSSLMKAVILFRPTPAFSPTSFWKRARFSAVDLLRCRFRFAAHFAAGLLNEFNFGGAKLAQFVVFHFCLLIEFLYSFPQRPDFRQR